LTTILTHCNPVQVSKDRKEFYDIEGGMRPDDQLRHFKLYHRNLNRTLRLKSQKKVYIYWKLKIMLIHRLWSTSWKHATRQTLSKASRNITSSAIHRKWCKGNLLQDIPRCFITTLFFKVIVLSFLVNPLSGHCS